MTNPAHRPPSPRQLRIKQRCLAVETQFSGRIGRAAFAARLLPLLVLLGLAYWNSLQDPPRVTGWLAIPLTVAAVYLAFLVLSHRFHDLGQSGANLLQIVLPVFVWLWIGGQLMEKLSAPVWIGTAVALAAWPVVMLLRLALRPGAP